MTAKRPSLLHLTEKYAQSIRSLCPNVLVPFTLTQCEIKARKVVSILSGGKHQRKNTL